MELIIDLYGNFKKLAFESVYEDGDLRLGGNKKEPATPVKKFKSYLKL